MVEVFGPLLNKANNVKWVVDGFVAVEFSLDVSVAQDSELWRQVGPVSTEDLTVESQWGDQGFLGSHLVRCFLVIGSVRCEMRGGG